MVCSGYTDCGYSKALNAILAKLGLMVIYGVRTPEQVVTSHCAV